MIGPAIFAGAALLLVTQGRAQSLTGKLTSQRLKTVTVGAEIKDEGSFQLQRSDTLTNWIAFTNFNSLPGTTISTVDSYTDSRRFYRLIRLTVPPVITLQPVGSTNYTGNTVILQAAASGSWPLRFQWYKDSQAIPGATSNILSFTGAASLSGTYLLLASNTWGTVLSTPVAVLITDLVPSTLGGRKLHFDIQGAQGDFLTSGSFDTTFDPSGFYNTTSSNAYLNDTGYWQYAVSGATTALAAFSFSIVYSDAQIGFTFQTPTTGTFTLVASNFSGYQTGQFTVR
jgi:hypothetical protein